MTTIADTVVSKIAGIAARDVDGVHAVGGGTARAVGALRERIPGARTNHAHLAKQFMLLIDGATVTALHESGPDQPGRPKPSPPHSSPRHRRASRSAIALCEVPMLLPLRGVPQFPVVVEERLVLTRFAVDVAVALIEPACVGVVAVDVDLE